MTLKYKLALQTPLTTAKPFSYGVLSLCKVLSQREFIPSEIKGNCDGSGTGESE